MADRHVQSVQSCSLTDILIKQRKPVLFVGEGNFTFTVAFAALRKYLQKSPDKQNSVWEGITATRFEPQSSEFGNQYVGDKLVEAEPAPVLLDVKLTCIEEIASCYTSSYKKKYFEDFTSWDRLEMIQLISELPS